MSSVALPAKNDSESAAKTSSTKDTSSSEKKPDFIRIKGSFCEELLKEAACLAAHAFVESPTYTFILHGHSDTSVVQEKLNPSNNENTDISSSTPNPIREQTIKFWTMLFEMNFRLQAKHGDEMFHCWYVDRGDRGAADNPRPQDLTNFFLFEKPGIPQISTFEMLKGGLISLWWNSSTPVLMRLMTVKAWYDEKERELLGPPRNLFGKVVRLERMVVRPGYQGKGLGSMALLAALKEADNDSDTENNNIKGCYLVTQLPKNVVFYERLGFKVIQNCRCPAQLGAVENWFMLRTSDHSDTK